MDSPPATTFTYDPSGVSTLTGAANSFPFLYQGLEHEVTDPGQLLFEPSGNVYNPQIQRELSQVGQQGLGDPPSGGGGAGYGGFGNFGGHGGSGQGGPSQLEGAFRQLGIVASAGSLASPVGWLGFSFSGFGSEGSGFFSGAMPIPFLSSLFNQGGDDDQPMRPRRRSTNWDKVGVPLDLTPNQQPIVYPSIDAAVRAAQPLAVNRFRTNGGREAYGGVYTSAKGFTYNGPFDSPGEFGGKIDLPSGFVATYHTHSQGFELSPIDRRTLGETNKPVYILTVPPGDEPAGNGGIIRYLPGKPREPELLP